MSEILFFCIGDSAKASTWSNVPYLFSRELERRGVKLHRINIAPNRLVGKLFDKTILPFSRFFFLGNAYSYNRTALCAFFANRRIKRAVKSFPNADYCFFICFHYYNSYSKTPSLLFCDWTFKHLIENRFHRKPNIFERRFIRQEHAAINNSQYVISLFTESAKVMKSDCPNANIFNFKGNVVNSFYEGSLPNPQQLIEKQKGKHILFIGNRAYRTAAVKTAEALQYIDGEATLDIIGMSAEELGVDNPRVKCHGYLHKDVENERKLYYKLLLEASVVTNTKPDWGGYSSIVESMYFFTPVLVAPFGEFVKEFGKDISFGKYNELFTPQGIACNIISILNSVNYQQMCQAAHDAVKDYTWECFVDKVLEIIDNR